MRLISMTLALILLLSLGIPANAAEVLPETSPAPTETPAPSESPTPEEKPEDESFTMDLSIVGVCLLATYKGGYY